MKPPKRKTLSERLAEAREDGRWRGIDDARVWLLTRARKLERSDEALVKTLVDEMFELHGTHKEKRT